MPIKAECGSCGAKFKAKDTMAGKRVGCPKCKQPMRIPSPEVVAVAPAAPAAPAPSPAEYNPILDLLDEAGVKSAPRGPVCGNCGSEMSQATVICIDCGFNHETGEKLKTEVYEDDDGAIDPGKTDADKIMAKAEKAIDESPVSAEGQDFGDGSESYLIAGIAIIGFIIFAVLGVTTVLSMDWIMTSLGLTAPGVSLIMAIVIAIGCIAWISSVAFLVDQTQGIICLCSLGTYCVIFGFMQGKNLLMPTIGLLVSFVIGLVSWLVIINTEDDKTGMLIDSAMALLGG